MFADRVDAGRQLAGRLRAYERARNTVVLGIPRGGVVVAAEVAHALELPLDIVLAAKIGAPHNPEFAIGALTADGNVLANPMVGFSQSEVDQMAGEARAKIARQLDSLRGGAEPQPIQGRIAIVVDDGLATGLTARAAIHYVRRQGASRVVLAVPVASADAAMILSKEADDFVAVLTDPNFFAVGQYYAHFGQTEDDEVRELLGGQQQPE
jgi:predicted phosphoribosyltransferase